MLHEFRLSRGLQLASDEDLPAHCFPCPVPSLCSVGFVFMYGHLMRTLSKTRRLGEKTPLLLFGWAYERYEAQYWWYESVVIAQRCVVVLWRRRVRACMRALLERP
jgi:hypothetical protein